MSKEAMKWYGAQRVDDASLSNLLYALAYEAGKGSGECTSSQAILSRRTGMTERAVRANLVVLACLEIISRKVRNKGRYGRTTDLITLALDRTFDVSKASVKAIRKSLKKKVPPENSSSGAEISHRNLVPLPPENSSGEYNKGNQEEPYQGEDSHADSYEGTYTRETPAVEIKHSLIRDGAGSDSTTSNVVSFRARAAR